MNLLKETLDKMTEIGKTPDDVVEVQWGVIMRVESGANYTVETFGTTWDRFAAVIKNVDYDNGYGTQEINDSMKVIFSDISWLERFEYDGAEQWKYKQCPKPAQNSATDDKDILCHVWDQPCDHCAHDNTCEGGVHCKDYLYWEEK